MMKSRFYSVLLTLGVIVLLTACHHSNDSAATTSSVRVVNATNVANLTLVSTNTTANSTAVTVASNIAAGSASSYTTIDDGSTALVASVGDGSLTASNSTTVGLTASYYYTVVAYARNGIINFTTLSDGTTGQTAPATGFALFSIGNPAPDAGPLDVYVVAPGSAIDDTVTPKYQNVYSGGSSLSQSIAAGTYDIIITAYNKPQDVRLKIPSLSLVDQEVATLMLTSTAGGTLVDGTLVQQDITTSAGGSVTAYPNSNARIRLVGAFPTSTLFQIYYNAAAPNGASYSDSLIANGIGAGQYKVVGSGTFIENAGFNLSTSSSAALLPNNIFADPTCTNTLYDATLHCSASSISASINGPLAAGGEYTLLVYGDPTNPSMQLLSDNNQAPTSARIRVINVVQPVSPTNPNFDVVDLYNSSVPLFQAVQFEQTSAYVGLTTGVSHLSAQIEALASPIVPIQDGKNIALGGVYTLIMGGNTGTTTTTTTATPPVTTTTSGFNSALILDRCLPTIQC